MNLWNVNWLLTGVEAATSDVDDDSRLFPSSVELMTLGEPLAVVERFGSARDAGRIDDSCRWVFAPRLRSSRVHTSMSDGGGY